LKRWLTIALGLLVLTIIIITSIRGGGAKGEKVYAEKVARRNIQSTVSASGEIDPKVKVNISSNVIGKIDHLYFKEGDSVHKGDRLVDLERVAYTAQRDRVTAELADRRITLHRSELNLENARLQLQRAEQLRREGIQAQELYDKARLEFDNARAAVDSAREGIHQASAGLSQATQDLSHTTIVSPINGKVVQLNAHEGEVVVTGTMNMVGSVIAVIADLSQILVEADVTETDVVQVKAGQHTRVRVDAVPDKEYVATVVEIGSSAVSKPNQPGVRYFNVKVALDTTDDRLRPGMSAQVDIVTDEQKNALSVPVQSVVEHAPSVLKKKAGDSSEEDDNEPKRKYVPLVADGKVKLVEVTTGTSNVTHVMIVSGLKGDEVVVTGPFRLLKKLRDGDSVQVEKGSEPAASKSDKNGEKKQ